MYAVRKKKNTRAKLDLVPGNLDLSGEDKPGTWSLSRGNGGKGSVKRAAGRSGREGERVRHGDLGKAKRGKVQGKGGPALKSYTVSIRSGSERT